MSTTAVNPATVFSFNDIIEYAKDAIVSKTIIKRSGGNVSLFAFDAGQGLSEHTAPFDAMVQVIDGQAEVIINGQSYIVPQGNTIIMPANISHAVKANERFKMVLTMIKETIATS